MLCEYPFDILKGESTSLKITILSSRNVKMKNKGGDGESQSEMAGEEKKERKKERTNK